MKWNFCVLFSSFNPQSPKQLQIFNVHSNIDNNNWNVLLKMQYKLCEDLKLKWIHFKAKTVDNNK